MGTLINDDRLTPTMTRVRCGDTQQFKQKGSEIEISIKSPEKHLYADLIDGKWHWVNGCAECNGKSRDWMTYIECDKHNVCRTCGNGRIAGITAWGGKHGWQCSTCHDREYETSKKEALASAIENGHQEIDCHYESEIICPYCATKQSSDDRHESEDGVECGTCGGIFNLEIEYSPSYSTYKVNAPEGYENLDKDSGDDS